MFYPFLRRLLLPFLYAVPLYLLNILHGGNLKSLACRPLGPFPLLVLRRLFVFVKLLLFLKNRPIVIA